MLKARDLQATKFKPQRGGSYQLSHQHFLSFCTCIIQKEVVPLQQQNPPRFPLEQRTRADLRFYIPMEYNKEPLSHAQLIELLKERGLLFYNEEAASSEFKMLSYFRLANYLRTFEVDADSHQFKDDSYFEDALGLYYFDKDLRALLFTAIQSIEIAIRSRMIDRIALAHGAFWFADERLATNRRLFAENLEHMRKEVNRSKEDFILDHKDKYDSPEFPPVWKTLEVVTFGTLSKLYNNLNDIPLKKKIAKDFKLPQHIYMESWMKSVAVLRNHIAHHARTWNRRFAFSPQIPHKLNNSWIETGNTRPYKLYTFLCILVYLENVIHPEKDFKDKVKDLLKKNPQVKLRAMGFPRGWEEQPLWRDEAE